MHRLSRPILAIVLLVALVATSYAGAELIPGGNLRLKLTGDLSPKRLPRTGRAPIAVTVGGKITTTDGTAPPKLKTLKIELNRNGNLDFDGLPVCEYDLIQPASSSRAQSACASSLVGQGSFDAEISLTGQDPYKAKGKLLAFNGKKNGKPVLYAQIYSAKPFATSFVIIFSIKKEHGTYGTALTAPLPQSLRNWGNLTGIELTLSRRYTFRGQSKSYLSAGCAAPKGVPKVNFDFVRTTFGFEGGKSLSGALRRTCKAS